MMMFIHVFMRPEKAKCIHKKLNVAYFQRKHKVKYALNVNIIFLVSGTFVISYTLFRDSCCNQDN